MGAHQPGWRSRILLFSICLGSFPIIADASWLGRSINIGLHQDSPHIRLTTNGGLTPQEIPPELPGTPPKGQLPNSGGRQPLPPGGFEPLPQPTPGTIQPGGVNP